MSQNRRRIRAVLTVLAAAAALAVPAPAPAAQADRATHDHTLRERPAPCTGEFQGDARLGPRHLPGPHEPPVGPLLLGYERTGGLAPDVFLEKYWEGPADSGGWKYPPNDGFADVNGAVDKQPRLLLPGRHLDRFGSEYGSYLAPAGDSYAERALPPQNLSTRDADFPCDYHLYVVTKPFTVWQGSVAPWFEQPGGGQQMKLDPVFLDPGEGERLNVKWLREHGYLAPVRA